MMLPIKMHSSHQVFSVKMAWIEDPNLNAPYMRINPISEGTTSDPILQLNR